MNRKAKREPMTFLTIGHGDQTPTEFIERLQSQGAGIVVDVRQDPAHCPMKAFRPAKLRDLLTANSIQYAAEPRLTPSYCAVRTAQDQLDRVMEAVERCRTKAEKLKNRIVVLLGAELEPNNAHRKKVLSYYFALGNVDLVHLTGEGDYLASSGTDYHPPFDRVDKAAVALGLGV